MDDHSEDNPWPSFADLLGATTLLFLVLFAVIAIPALEAVGRSKEQASTRQSISARLDTLSKGWQVTEVGDYIRVIIPENATFLAGRSDLGSMVEEGKQTLLDLGARINEMEEIIDQVQVVGHTSIEGVGNLDLSSRRATTIALFLINRAKVPPCLVTALGRGPLYPYEPDQRKADPRRVDARDRRIELEIRPRLPNDTTQAARRGSCVSLPESDLGRL